MTKLLCLPFAARNPCCSRCVRSTSQCKYSKRRWHQPDQPEHRQQHHSNHSDRDTVRARRHQLHLTSGALARHRVLPFKRYMTPFVAPNTGKVYLLQESTCEIFCVYRCLQSDIRCLMSPCRTQTDLDQATGRMRCKTPSNMKHFIRRGSRVFDTVISPFLSLSALSLI